MVIFFSFLRNGTCFWFNKLWVSVSHHCVFLDPTIFSHCNRHFHGYLLLRHGLSDKLWCKVPVDGAGYGFPHSSISVTLQRYAESQSILWVLELSKLSAEAVGCVETKASLVLWDSVSRTRSFVTRANKCFSVVTLFQFSLSVTVQFRT